MPEQRPSETDDPKPVEGLEGVYAALAGRPEALATVRRFAHFHAVALWELERIRETQLRVGIPSARAFAELDEGVRTALVDLVFVWSHLPPKASKHADRLRETTQRLTIVHERALRTAGER